MLELARQTGLSLLRLGEKSIESQQCLCHRPLMALCGGAHLSGHVSLQARLRGLGLCAQPHLKLCEALVEL